VEQDYSMQVTK